MMKSLLVLALTALFFRHGSAKAVMIMMDVASITLDGDGNVVTVTDEFITYGFNDEEAAVAALEYYDTASIPTQNFTRVYNPCNRTDSLCAQGCNHTDIGIYTCFCDAGYRDISTKTVEPATTAVQPALTCEDIDECEGNDTVCGVGTEACLNLPGSYLCACVLGYIYDAVNQLCINVNECEDPMNGCDVNADCSDTIGSYTCLCRDGYTGSGLNCTDVDECDDVTTNDCDPNAICVNLPATFACACAPGFLGNGTFCEDVNECNDPMLNNCGDNADCTNTIGNFNCTCTIGYFGDGATCEVITCSEEPTIPENGKVNCTDTNQHGSVCTYSCDTGYGISSLELGSTTCTDDLDGDSTGFWSGEAPSCDAITCPEQSPPSNGGVSCSNSNLYGSTCTFTCDSGYSLSDVTTANTTCADLGVWSNGTPSCQDVNECSDESLYSCHPDAECVNNVGSYSCRCKNGYLGDGFISCEDEDECADPMLNICNVNATCDNTVGSFTCTCLNGYVGNGVFCEDVDECSNSTLYTCDENALCENTIMSYNCLCVAGYFGDGKTCEDIDECETTSNDCDVNADCVNLDGTFDCVCPAGWEGDGRACTEIAEPTDGGFIEWLSLYCGHKTSMLRQFLHHFNYVLDDMH